MFRIYLLFICCVIAIKFDYVGSLVAMTTVMLKNMKLKILRSECKVFYNLIEINRIDEYFFKDKQFNFQIKFEMDKIPFACLMQN